MKYTRRRYNESRSGFPIHLIIPGGSILLLSLVLTVALAACQQNNPDTNYLSQEDNGTTVTSSTSTTAGIMNNANTTATSVQPSTNKDESRQEPKPEQMLEASVLRVVDGDTIVVDISGTPYKVRLIGIDTPERGRPYYRVATNKTKELVAGKNVRLEKDVSETDRYGRLLRYVYVDNMFVNAELVEQGYAVPATFPPDVKYVELFRKLSTEARANDRGLWSR